MRRIVTLTLALALVCFIPAVAFAEAELLQNGSFAGLTALPDGWFENVWHSGAEEYHIAPDAALSAVYIHNPVENDTRLCQSVKVEGNVYYTLSCDVMVRGVEGGAGASLSVLDTLAASAPLLGDSGWQHVELTGVTGKKQKEITVCIGLGGYSALSKGEAWFKNVSLVQTAKTAGAAAFSEAEFEPAADMDYTAGKVPYFGAMLLTSLFTAAAIWAIARFVIARASALRPLGAGGARGTRMAILAAALILRVALSPLVYGHTTDMPCFMAWGNALCENGFGAFYTSGMFADYPPGYMYVLGLNAWLAKALGLTYGANGYVLLFKLPAMLADLVSAWILYAMAEKSLGERAALWLCAVAAFNPACVFLSGGWGQIDSLLTLLLVAAIWCFLHDKRILAGAVYGLAISIKPQALMLGPLLATAYFAACKTRRDVLRTIAAVLSAFAVIFLLALPFWSIQPADWLLEKYFSTATSYPYASIEAFNLMALLGGNWAAVDTVPFLFSYGTWGTILMAAAVLFTCVSYVRAGRKTGGGLWLCAAYLLCALFTLGQYMHERYLFPVLLLLLIAFIQLRDRRLFKVYGLFTVSLLFNVLAAFVIVDNQGARGAQYTGMTLCGSLLCVAAFAYFTLVFVDILYGGRLQPAFTEPAGGPPAYAEPLPPRDGRLMERKDRLLCGGLTLLYAVVAFINLGSLKAPENAYIGQTGDSVRLTWQGDAATEIWIFGGIAEGSVIFIAEDGTETPYAQTFDDMFRWAVVPCEGAGQSLTMEVVSGEVRFNEIALRSGETLLAAASESPALLDEQDTVPAEPSYLNGMYFDELYHGRTAYEHLHGLDPYENSHPPLGKVLIMLGVAVFGMNAFGWRVVGTLLGVCMLPILYRFAKRLFGKAEYAFLAAALFALDFMHYTQTRIATIDVYAVFFILLMYSAMYRYYGMDFFRDGLKKTLGPLALGGVFFGLGAASKWTCIYAGGGLAVIFFTSLVQRYLESRRLKASENAQEREKGEKFTRYALLTLLWCCLFYIVVPVGIYLASYIPYYLCAEAYDLRGVWEVQEFMFSYHSGLTATHPSQSAWWQWPLDLRPTWYYVGYGADTTRASTISAFGNPAVWWVCSAGLAVLVAKLINGRIKPEKGMFVLLVAAAANYLPWVLVPRCTFSYHYFPMVPIIILCTVYLVRDMELHKPALAWVKWGWLGLCTLLFAAFYPVISGAEASINYIHALEWLPTWMFLGY